MKKIIVLIVSLFIAGFSFCQVNNLGGTGGGLTDPVSELTITDTLTISGVLKYIPPHSMMSFADSAITPAMTEDNWVSVTNATSSLFTSNDTESITVVGDSVTISAGGNGDYMMDISFSYSGANTDIYEVSIFKNNAIESTPMPRSMTSNSTGVISINWYCVGCVAGDDFILKIRNTNNSNDATFVGCQWRVWMLHPEE